MAKLGLRRQLPPADEVQRAALSLNPKAWAQHGGEVVPSVPVVGR
jgi:hypothetical protein